MSILLVVLAGVYLITVVGAYKETLPTFARELYSTPEELPRVFKGVLVFASIIWPVVYTLTTIKAAFRDPS